MTELNFTPFLTILSLLGVVFLLALLSFWPVFFLRRKNRHFYWIASSMLIVALGSWVMIYFQLERSRLRRAEAEAVKATRQALVDGGDSAAIAAGLSRVLESEEFRAASAGERYRLWSGVVRQTGDGQ